MVVNSSSLSVCWKCVYDYSAHQIISPNNPLILIHVVNYNVDFTYAGSLKEIGKAPRNVKFEKYDRRSMHRRVPYFYVEHGPYF